jgi:hypothetical protein
LDTKKFITAGKEIEGKTVETCFEYGDLCIKFTDGTFFVIHPSSAEESASLSYLKEDSIDLYDKMMLNIITEEEYHEETIKRKEKIIKNREDIEKEELKRLKAKYESHN